MPFNVTMKNQKQNKAKPQMSLDPLKSAKARRAKRRAQRISRKKNRY